MSCWEERVTEEELDNINFALSLISRRDLMNRTLQGDVFSKLIENGLTQQEADEAIDLRIGMTR